MKADLILKALCINNLDLDDCYVITTEEFPWEDLKRFFPYGTSDGEVQSFTSYFYYWSIVPNVMNLKLFDKPDVTLYLSDSESEIYLWKIE